MNCPKCNSSKIVKDGIVKGKQRFLCKNCKFRFTVMYRGKPPDLKRQAIELYLEGLGFRSIERILKVSNVSVMNWVREFGKKLDQIKRVEASIDVIEMDEIHTYIEGKKTTAGSGWLLIGLGKESLESCLVREVRKPE